jgi:lipid II isoglutaminyl synthase (glutamine-hydrolysing)
VITGTNGKTTTTKIVSELLESQGLKVLTNKSGSNFVRGTITTVIDNASLSVRLPYDIAIFEQDEAHAVRFVGQVKPRGVVALNVMRDQMDRFGEIDTTAKLINKVVESASEWVVLNANDERVAKMVPKVAKTFWYGHSKALQSNFLTDDELHQQEQPSYTQAGIMTVELKAFDDKKISVYINKKAYDLDSMLRGSHNAINLTAALTVVKAILPNVEVEKVLETTSTLQPAFGRGEVISLPSGGRVTLQLVKNPGGFRHALGMLKLTRYGAVGIAINDDYADGRDVSWLWDVDFRLLNNLSQEVICSGVRGYDMAVRLKYDEVKVSIVDPSLAELITAINKCLTSSSDNAIIFCTYTAMLKIRALYKKQIPGIHEVRV